jgi:hypothetical protein
MKQVITTTTIDLTKISVDFQLKFDALDAVLLVTTGGLGYLARAAYNHFDGKAERDIDLQRRNLTAVLDEAHSKGAKSIIVRVNREVPIYAPSGGEVRVLANNGTAREFEISWV